MSLHGKIKDFSRWWQKIAKKIGDFQARLLLTIFYFNVVLPLGLIVRLFGGVVVGKALYNGAFSFRDTVILTA